MSRPDAAASAALDANVIKPVFLAFLDFADEPVRANTSGASITLTGTGEPDIDGFQFDGISADFVNVTPVKQGQGGSDSVVVELSGLPVLDSDQLNQVGDPANWQGREARLWRIIRNESNAQQGGIQHLYTGYMTSLDIKSTPEEQKIVITIESYLATFSQASFRTYDQSAFDPDDKSYEAAIAITNGISGNPLTNNTSVGGAGGGRINNETLMSRNEMV